MSGSVISRDLSCFILGPVPPNISPAEVFFPVVKDKLSDVFMGTKQQISSTLNQNTLFLISNVRHLQISSFSVFGHIFWGAGVK